MFELITGRTPFDGDLRALIEAHQRVAPPRAKQYAPDISHDLDELIAQMLAKDPNARPQSMAQVMATLMQIGAVRAGAAMTMMPTPAHVVALQQMHQMPPQMAQQLAQGMPMQPPPMVQMQPHMAQQPMPHMQMQPMMRNPGADDSGVLVVPPSPPHGMRRPMTPFGAAPADVTERTRDAKKKKGRAPFAAAAIAAFVVAAALTAIAARGRTKTAAASPVPVPPIATQKAPAP